MKARHNRQLTRNKDVRVEIDAYRRAGWIVAGKDSNGHIELEHPDASDVHRLPSTPSSRHWRENKRKVAAALLGLDVADLEQEMGVHRGYRKKKFSHKAKQAPPRPRVVAKAAADDPFPADLPSAAELRRQCYVLKEQLNTAPPETPVAAISIVEKRLAEKQRLYGEACRRERRAA